MSELHEELLQIADKIELYAQEAKQENIILPLSKLGEAANTVGKAWSRSWLGYHAFIYYNNLQVPPPGAHFSQEWGMEELFTQSDGTTGDWREYKNDDVIKTIYALAGNPNLDSARELSEKAENAFDTEKHEVLSLLSTTLSEKSDPFISNLKDDVEKLNVLSQSQVIRHLRPSGQFISRDSLAVHQGLRTPPHISVLSEIMALQNASSCCQKLGQIARRAGSHLARQTHRSAHSKQIEQSRVSEAMESLDRLKGVAETKRETKNSGDTYNIDAEHVSLGDNAQHASRDNKITTPEPKKEKGRWGLILFGLAAIATVLIFLFGDNIWGRFSKKLKSKTPTDKQLETSKTEPNDPSLIKVNSQQGSALIDGTKMTAPQVTFSSETDGEITIIDSVSETKGTKIDVNEGGQIKLKDGAIIDQN